MRCRCNDVRNCRSDIEILKRVLYKMSETELDYNGLQQLQNQIYQLGIEAYEVPTQNRNALQSEFNRNNQCNKGIFNDCKNHITQTMRTLEQDLTRIQREDKEYHEKQASQ